MFLHPLWLLALAEASVRSDPDAPLVEPPQAAAAPPVEPPQAAAPNPERQVSVSQQAKLHRRAQRWARAQGGRR